MLVGWIKDLPLSNMHPTRCSDTHGETAIKPVIPTYYPVVVRLFGILKGAGSYDVDFSQDAGVSCPEVAKILVNSTIDYVFDFNSSKIRGAVSFDYN